jgi:hypothetical protein
VINPDNESNGAYSGAQPCHNRRKSLSFQELHKDIVPDNICDPDSWRIFFLN